MMAPRPLPAGGAGLSHPALFYRGTEEYLAGTVPFIRAGLAAGEPVAVAVPGPNLRLILAELGVDAHRVQAYDMTRAGRNPGAIIPGLLHAVADAHRAGRVRIIGEPIWPDRTAVEYPACAQHEALINLAFADRPVTILCPYDAARLSPRIIADAEATHPWLADSAGERISVGYAPERVVTDYNLPLPLPPVTAPTLIFDAGTLVLARRFARGHATRLGLSGGEHVELELLVGELAENSVTHGGGTGSLSVWAQDGYLICEVRDAGHITDPLAGRRPADHRRLSGRGLLLVHLLSDLVRVHTSPAGTTVRLYLALPSAEPRTPPDAGADVASAPLAPPGPVEQTGRPAAGAPRRSHLPDAIQAVVDLARQLRESEWWGAGSPEHAPQLRMVLDALTAAERLIRTVQRWQVQLVGSARAQGASWSEIGRSLGVTKQAAHERYRAGDKPSHPHREQGGPGPSHLPRGGPGPRLR